jgi:predicted dehydrogenase
VSRWRVGIVGTGAWVDAALAPVLRDDLPTTIAWIVGRSVERAELAARRLGVRQAFGSIHEALNDPPDLVVVAAPDDVHDEVCRAALAARVPVFCEKPVTERVVTAYALAEFARDAAVPATIGYSFRFSPAIRALRDDLDSGRLGEPWLIELAEYNAQFHPTSGKSPGWKADPRRAPGGVLLEYGSHALDLAMWLLGPLREERANLVRVLRGAGGCDIATMQFRSDSGVPGLLATSWIVPGTAPGVRVRLHGSRASAEAELSRALPGGESYRVFGLDGSNSQTELEPIDQSPGVYARRHIQHFLSELDKSPPSGVPTFEDGLRVQRLIEAALESSTQWDLANG